MTDFPGQDLPHDVECLIHAARNYVRPSEDLRPRVIELARAERQERRMQRGLAQMAAIIFLLVTMVTVYRQPEGTLGNRVFLPAGEVILNEVEAANSNDPSWEMVESFTDLKRRQALLLQL